MKLDSILTLAAIALGTTPVMAAEGQWILQGVAYETDTLQHYQAGPGTTITVLDLVAGRGSDKEIKQRVWYSVTDLTNPDVEIKTVCGSNIRTSNMTVPAMVNSRKGDGNVYFLGVNADLFSTNGPIGTSIMNGEVLKTAKESTAWKAVGVEDNGALYFGTAKLTFSAKLNGAMEYAPSLVNVPRAANECVLYTRRWGTTTRTTEGETGIEIALRPADGILHSDGPTVCTVESAPVKNGGNMAIPEGCFVISSTVASHIRDLGLMKAGDTYTITPAGISIAASAYSSHSFTKCVELCGGDPMLLVGGETLASYATMPNYDARRPRTAIGTDATHTIMTLLVVDGDSFNKGISAGVDAKDLAAMMKQLGCYDALNFDGGGSSTMYTDAFGVLNRPSDGKDRAVRNGWFITTPDRSDVETASIAFADPHKTLAIGDTYTPVFYAYNNSGLPVNTDLQGVKLETPVELGTVSADGRTLTVTGDGTYALTARLGGHKCTIAVRAGDYKANSGSSSLSAVEAASDAKTEYFTLDGLEADPQALTPGIYLRRSGSQCEKIIVK